MYIYIWIRHPKKEQKKIVVKEIECIPSKWSSWWKLNFIGFKQHDSNSKFRLKRLSIKFGHCIYWQFITVDFSWIKVFVEFIILHRLFCYNIYWMVSVKCFIHCAKMVGLHAVYTCSFFRFMVLREVFKNPSNGKIPLRGYPPPPLTDFGQPKS